MMNKAIMLIEGAIGTSTSHLFRFPSLSGSCSTSSALRCQGGGRVVEPSPLTAIGTRVISRSLLSSFHIWDPTQERCTSTAASGK